MCQHSAKCFTAVHYREVEAIIEQNSLLLETPDRRLNHLPAAVLHFSTDVLKDTNNTQENNSI